MGLSDQFSADAGLVNIGFNDGGFSDGGELESTGSLEAKMACRSWPEGYVKIWPKTLFAEDNSFAMAA